MKIISTYHDAYSIAKDYTEEHLSNTLTYIFDTHYTCYMLCVKDKTIEFCKLESNKGDPQIDKRIQKTLKNKKIKSSTKTWRVMGCIIKPFKKEKTFAKEWVKFLDNIKDRLPNGVFILSLSDSILLPEEKKGGFLPIFAYSGKVGYKDIAIPTYDDIFDNEIGNVETEWKNKKEIAVFRGGSTGCGFDENTNQRLKLSTMKNELLDVGITKYTSNLKYGNDINKVKKVSPIVGSLTWKQQSEYKYIIHVDGNVVAYRLLKSMLTSSLILRVKSDFIHWCDDTVEDGKHFISIKEDLSDLIEKIEWCKSHDKECKKIAKQGYDFARRVLDRSYIENAFINIIQGDG